MNIYSHWAAIANGLAKLAFPLAVLFSLACFAGPRDDAVAVVKAYKQVNASDVTYTYAVTNRGDLPLLSFTVGFDYYRGNPELSGAHPAAVLSPGQWQGQVVSLEESDRYEVRWDITAAAGSIKPGQTLSGFRIVLPRDDVRFGNSKWTVTVDGPPTHASSGLQLVQGPPPSLDTVPPTIAVAVTPSVLWPPNKRIVDVTAVVTVSDNMDPNPQVKLVSITCNECDDPAGDIRDADIGTDDRRFQLRADRIGRRKEGRVYTIKYSATDSAGNVATAEAQVTIPHDQRK